MTHQPDDRTPEERAGGTDDAKRPLDEEAAWLEIVANYGDRPEMGSDVGPDGATEGPAAADPAGPVDQSASAASSGSLFDRAYLDAQLERAEQERDDLSGDGPVPWDDEGHYVPPPPPPLPVLEPRRKAAWIGLFGSPLAMLLGIVFGWTYPAWISFVLVVAFVGGFGYLVATMPRGRRDDWSGDDGAVV
jgi:hypothetical protein